MPMNYIQGHNHTIFMREAPVRMSDSAYEYMDSIPKLPRLTAQQEQDLGKRIQAGDTQAMHTLVEHNLRLVISVAKFYAKNDTLVDMLDLIQEGNIGLMTAARKFDYRKGNKFSTYAVYWIRQYISRMIPELERAVHLPCYVHENVVALKKHSWLLANQLDREPTLAELAEYTEWQQEYVAHLQTLIHLPLSLDATVENTDELSWLDLLEDTSDTNTFDERSYDMRQTVAQVLDKLDTREREVVKLRFGLSEEGNERTHTLKEVGTLYGISRERVRQIEEIALKKLKKFLSPVIDEVLA